MYKVCDLHTFTCKSQKYPALPPVVNPAGHVTFLKTYMLQYIRQNLCSEKYDNGYFTVKITRAFGSPKQTTDSMDVNGWFISLVSIRKTSAKLSATSLSNPVCPTVPSLLLLRYVHFRTEWKMATQILHKYKFPSA